MADLKALEAFALCWPNDARPLLFLTREQAEENRKWFTKNYKLDRNGHPRGEPFIVKLSGAYNTAAQEGHVIGMPDKDGGTKG